MKTFDKSQLKKLKANPPTESPPQPKTRANLDLVVMAVNYMYGEGHETVQSTQVARILKALDLVSRWNTKGGHGFSKLLGDCLGGHGLKLDEIGRAKGGKRFKIPSGGITDSYLKSKGIVI